MSAAVAELFMAVCRAEVMALKPGNVHVHAAGHGMTVEDFLRSAEASAPEIARSGTPVGERILRAVRATRSVVDCNTNLGILLLCAPLARAAELPAARPLRDRLPRPLVRRSASHRPAVRDVLRSMTSPARRRSTCAWS